jgi:hypothetical protein
MWDLWTTMCQEKGFLRKRPLFPVSIIPPMYHAQSFAHQDGCIILATDSVFNTPDTSLLDRWAGNLKVHAKIKYVTSRRGFGVTYFFSILCLTAVPIHQGRDIS